MMSTDANHREFSLIATSPPWPAERRRFPMLKGSDNVQKLGDRQTLLAEAMRKWEKAKTKLESCEWLVEKLQREVKELEAAVLAERSPPIKRGNRPKIERTETPPTPADEEPKKGRKKKGG
jgi:hypothetical protein